MENREYESAQIVDSLITNDEEPAKAGREDEIHGKITGGRLTDERYMSLRSCGSSQGSR